MGCNDREPVGRITEIYGSGQTIAVLLATKNGLYRGAVACRRFTLAPLLLTLACKTHSATPDGENRLPQPDALGTRTHVANVRQIRGEDLGRLARAYAGRGTLFNIWATWCESCRGEMPQLRQLAEGYENQGIHVVLVSVDEPAQFDRLMARISPLGLKPPAWTATRPLREFKAALAKNWLGNIPVSFLYDARGRRHYFWNGPTEIAEVKPILDGFLSGRNIDGEALYELSAGAVDSSVTQVTGK